MEYFIVWWFFLAFIQFLRIASSTVDNGDDFITWFKGLGWLVFLTPLLPLTAVLQITGVEVDYRCVDCGEITTGEEE